MSALAVAGDPPIGIAGGISAVGTHWCWRMNALFALRYNLGQASKAFNAGNPVYAGRNCGKDDKPVWPAVVPAPDRSTTGDPLRAK